MISATDQELLLYWTWIGVFINLQSISELHDKKGEAE